MRTLSFDTSTADTHLALLEDKDIVLKEVVKGEADGRNQCNAFLMPAIDRAFTKLGWDRASLNLIVCGAGPGGFTGIRVGVVTARTLAQALDLPLVSVLNLDVLSHEFLATEARQANQASSASHESHRSQAEDNTAIVKYAGKSTLSGSGDRAPLAVSNFFVLAFNKDQTKDMTLDIVDGRYGFGFCADGSLLASLSVSTRLVFADTITQQAALACGLADTKEHVLLPMVENIACIQGQIALDELSCKGYAPDSLKALYPWHKVEPAYFREPSISKAGASK